jgi:hypothetical protein
MQTMKYQDVLDQAKETEYIRALMSARGVEPENEVDQAFLDMLKADEEDDFDYEGASEMMERDLK